MAMSDDFLPAHSMAEVYLYLMITACPKCGQGKLNPLTTSLPQADQPNKAQVLARCGKCQGEQTLSFVLPAEYVPSGQGPQSGVRISRTDQPSRIIDVAQWLTLFHVILEAASREKDRGKARLLGYDAAQCLEEAVKFYEPDNDLPPASAFFSEETRRQCTDHPELFARSRLIEQRARLPALDAMERQLRARKEKLGKRWWQFWINEDEQ